MKISIENNANDKLKWVTFYCANLEEILLKEQFFKTVLLRLLNGRSINLITVAPQNYSLAYDFTPYHSRTIGGTSFLVNNIGNCDFDLVEKIALSEEFRRTLLIMVKRSPALSDSELDEIVGLIKNKPVTISDEVIFCEDDGDSLCLYNSSIDTTELVSISKSIASDVKVEIT